MPRPIPSPRERAVAILTLSGREIGHELGITPHAVRHTLHIVYNSVGIQPRAGRRDLGRALVAGIISVLDLPAEKHPIYAA